MTLRAMELFDKIDK